MSSKCPTSHSLDQYEERLLAAATTGVIGLEEFVKVGAWFDSTEGASDR